MSTTEDTATANDECSKSISSPCPTSTEPRDSTSNWVGDSTMTSRRSTGSASSSSHPRARGPRSRSARDSPRPRQARPRARSIVSDIEAAHDGLVGRGIDVSDVWHGPPFPAEARQPGPDPERTSYGSFCSFNDPDGNLWLVQEVTTRLPGRIDPTETAFASAEDLENALWRAEAAHVEHQKRTGRSHLLHRSSEDETWPAWYASYMVAEQAGSDLPA